ncbi:hypothetical protein Hanom_Chr07g00651681 [Helianthus anomalus]
MDEDKVVSLYVVAFEREGGKMTTLPKKPDEELWYLRIVKNFVLTRDDDLSAQPAAGAVIRRPKPEPKDTADIPPSNPHDPIDLESSPERLVKKKAGKRKQTDAEDEGQPAKKIQRKTITRKGNLDAFISEYVPCECYLLIPCFLFPQIIVIVMFLFQKNKYLLFPQNHQLWQTKNYHLLLHAPLLLSSWRILRFLRRGRLLGLKILNLLMLL